MATHSKTELLNWLKEPGRLLGNDMVFAIDKAKADALLTQEYIRRFKTSSYFAPVNGETAADNGYKVFMQNFVLDHPRLSFDNVDITSSKASLRMKIVGGNQVDLKQAGAHWYPRRIDSLDPLVGPELSLKLELSDVPGYVDADSRIMLDLRNSDNFVLTFSDSNRVRQLGGDFFKELFRELPAEKRVWSLGAVERGPDELLRPESFRLRTQRNPSAAFAPATGVDQPDVDGAVMGLVRMVGNDGQQTVVPGVDYRYLIPSDNAGYSASVLLERKRVIMAALARSLPRANFGDLAFKFEFRGGDVIATAVSGWMEFPSGDWSDEHWERTTFICDMKLVVPVFRVLLKDVLSLTFVGGKVSMDMACFFTADSDVTRYWEIPPHPHLNAQAYEVGWVADFTLDFRASWTLVDIQGGVLKLDAFALDVGTIANNYPRRREPLPPGVEKGTPYSMEHGIFVSLSPWQAIIKVVQEKSFPALRAVFAKDLRIDIATSDVVAQTLKLNFGGALVSAEHHAPNDLASFGHVNPRLTAFTVTPLESTIIHNNTLQFATVPAQANVIWSAESVEGSNDAPGSFDKAMYHAPPASDIQGAFTRVRITATDPSTGYSASALVSVVKNSISLSPLVEVCQVGDAGVSLKAGNAGQGELRWTVLGSAPHGRLAHATGQANTYIPGGNITGKAYLVEQVEVRNTQSNEQRTLCVVTTMTTKMSYAMVVAKREAQRLWLQLFVDDEPGITDLEVLHGPGKIARDAEGEPYYEADSASQAPFCVVGGLLKEGRFSFEGFIVLPLPLGEHTAAYQQLELAAHRAARTD